MKLLVIGPDMRDLGRVKNFTGVQAHYLARELRKRGVALQFIEHKNPDPLRYFESIDAIGCDHVLALGLRYFTHQPVGCAEVLKRKVPGAVTMLHDGLVHEYLSACMQGVDCTFMFRNDEQRTKNWARYAKSNHYIGWAADSDLLFPEQKQGELRILIDHPYYKGGKPDITETVTRNAISFVGSGMWRGKFQAVRLRRLVNGGAEDVYTNDMLVRKFDRQHIPFPEIAREYRRTTIYLVTHKESVGLTALELGYCGALVVAPKEMIYGDRLATVRHIEYHDDERIPWGDVLAEIDIQAAASKARVQTWEAVAERMLEWFANYK